MEYNVYCDESCHLEHDRSPVMVLGAVYLDSDNVQSVTKRIREIKEENHISQHTEVKWTKISPACMKLYLDLIDYFFDDDDLHFRCLIANKTHLHHEEFHQTHDEWYYKMYFDMLKIIFSPKNSYNIYLDIKDSNSHDRCEKLNEVLCNNAFDFKRDIIKKVQAVRSHEIQILQITDVLNGAVSMVNRYKDLSEISPAKKVIIDRIKERSGYTLSFRTLYREDKFNIFTWEGKE